MKRKLGVAVLLMAVGARADGSAGWPPFLPPAEQFPAGVVAGVERVWRDPTLRRTVEAEPVAVPRSVYLAFVDAPEVTAAAARHLKIANYEVRQLGDGLYEADDHDGARGVYEVLLRRDGRRVIFSRGSHSGAILRTIRGSALTVMDFEGRGEGTAPRLTAYVLIDNPVAAGLARVLITVFGHLADSKLTEGFRVTARVATWARERPDEFCGWLETAPAEPSSRRALLEALGPCRQAAVTPPRR